MIDLTTKFTAKESTKYKSYLAGWNTLQPYMMSLPIDDNSLRTMRTMLSMEIKGKCREQMIKRLVGRIRTIRHLLEEQYLYSIMGDAYMAIKPRKRKPIKRKVKAKEPPPMPKVEGTAEMLIGSGE